VIAVKIPVAPPTVLFLKKFIHARASVQDGMIYGNINKVAICFFHRRSVLVTSHAKPPPTRIATKHGPMEHTREFNKGL